MATVAEEHAIALIYNEGIEDRIATFETRLGSPQDVESWFDGKDPVVVVEELSASVTRIRRRQGAGRLPVEEILRAAERAGFWEQLSRVFPENAGAGHWCGRWDSAKWALTKNTAAWTACGAT
jgi:L-amino acid N-acyltransferase YncA